MHHAMWPNYTCIRKVFLDVGYYDPEVKNAFGEYSVSRRDFMAAMGAGQRSIQGGRV